MKKNFKRCFSLMLALSIVLSLFVVTPASAAGMDDEYDGSQLWLNYTLVDDAERLAEYKAAAASIVVQNENASPVYRHTVKQTDQDGNETEAVWDPQQPQDAQETVVDTTLEAARLELQRAFQGLLGETVGTADVVSDGAVVVGTPETSDIIAGLQLGSALEAVGDEGYLIRSVTIDGKKATVIAGNTEIGALYGTYAFIRLMQTHKPVSSLDIADSPKVNHRRLNNWDTERLYASTAANGEGINGGTEDGSIFNFKTSTGDLRLPLILDRYIVFARMCASVGINEITINNVNADYKYLSEDYIQREAALADVLRPYGIRIGLSVRYVSPTDAQCNTEDDIAAGGPALVDKNTEADHANPYSAVFQNWWTQKTDQIRSRIPDFIGYTVKANSEGQPGPQDYGYNHGDGAHGLGEALGKAADIQGYPNDMTLFWRTFVYNADVDMDRLKRPYKEFVPINDSEDNSFADPRVFVQTKNGPLDFQGREPFHPMFGAMDHTNQAIELQITQEYTGHHVSLCYLAPMWEEVFKSDTYAEGQGTLVGEIIDGSAQGQNDTAIVGVNNIGNAPNMTGHHFSQANFFAFGRQAWDWTLDSESIAEDWIRMTWSNDQEVVDTILQIMMGSWEALVSYQTPLGVGHQMTGTGTHYFPNPSQIIYNGGQIRDDWSPAYYSRVDGVGMGFNRSGNKELTSFGLQDGSNLTGQYAPELEALYGDIDSVPENLMLWFHHVPWDHVMKSGNTFWEEIVYLTQTGVQYCTWMREAWASLDGKIDQRRFDEVTEKLWRQEIDAGEWRDVYFGYWQDANNLSTAVDSGPLSIALTLGEGENAKTYQGFNLAVDSFNKTATGNLPNTDERYDRYIAAGGSIADACGAPFNSMFKPVDKSYKLPVPQGVDVSKIAVEFLVPDSSAQWSVVEKSSSGATIRVYKEGSFGPLVKNYVFEFVADTGLSSVSLDGTALRNFSPEQDTYSVWIDGDTDQAPVVAAEASDPNASVTVSQAAGIPGSAAVTVANGDSSKVYTIRFVRPAAQTEDFSGETLGEQWSWIREDNTSWNLADGALTITTQDGDLKADTNTAKNIPLLPINDGDWSVEGKITLSAVPTKAGQQGGLVIYQDDDNYLKAALEYCSSGSGWWAQQYLRLSFCKEIDGSFSEVFYDALETEENLALTNNTLWLRITKEGNVYKAYCATDPNAAYKSLGSCTADLTDPKAGLLAAHGDSGSALEVTFDDIKVSDLGQNPQPDSSSGGSSSGGSSSVTVPVNGDENSIKVSASVSGSTATVSKIDTDQLKQVAGSEVDTGMVEIDFTNLGKTIDTVNLPASAVKEIAGAANDSANDTEGLTIKLSTGEVAFDAAALDAVQAQASGSQITLSVTPAKASALNDRQKEAAGSAPVFDLTLKSGGKAITDFGDGCITVSLPHTLKEGQNPSGVVVYYLDSEGNLHACQTTYDVRTKTVVFTTNHLSLYMVGYDEAAAWSNPFSDVAEGAWYYEAVKLVSENGLMNGLGGGRFGPDNNLSRAELAQILYNKEGAPAASGSAFSDVTSDSWYASAVAWAAEKGIVSGYGDGRFGPNDLITREQLAIMLWRYAGSPAPSAQALDFPDAGSASGYALEALRWAVENGIISGYGSGQLAPQGLATRAQVAQMMKNFLER